MNRPVFPRMSIEAFEAWAERQDGRYELVRGQPVMMNQTTLYHSRLASNVHGWLWQTIDRTRYDIASGDFGLKTGEDTIRLADIMVTLAEGSGKDRRTDQALLRIEILSSSTTSDDFGRKQVDYLALPSLQAYLIVAQDTHCIWAWIKGDEGFPEKPEVIEALDAVITIDALNLHMPMSEIFRRVDL